MTGLIAIDESGDLGTEGSRFFLMAAVVTKRTKHLLKAYKAIPTIDGKELKFYNFRDDERLSILSEIAAADVKIIYVCIDKHSSNEPYRSGKELYYHALRELMKHALESYEHQDINILVDDNRFIKTDKLTKMGMELSSDLNKNVKRCEKVFSHKCIKIADCIAGSIWRSYEREDEGCYSIIKAKISFAREPLGPR